MIHSHRLPAPTALLLAGLMLATPSALAQDDDRPTPSAPETVAAAGAQDPEPVEVRNGQSSERLVKLGWSKSPIEESFPWIAQVTGKIVMPINPVGFTGKNFTLITEKPVTIDRTLDLLFEAFRFNGIGVIERDDVLIIGPVDDVAKILRQPILKADDRVAERTDKGTLVVKFFRLKKVKAEDALDIINAYDIQSPAFVNADANSNQVIVYGDIGLCQHIEEIIEELDNVYVEPKTQTFRLRYADATDVSNNILDLFESSSTGSTTSRNSRSPQQRGGAQQRGRTQTPAVPGSVVGPEIELRVTVNAQQNSVTTTGDPLVIEEIAKLIDTEWDLPRSPGTSRIYRLLYTDPVVVADKINSLLGQGSGGTAGRGNARGASRTGGTGGGDASQILSGIYQIEPFPESSDLVVFSKTEEALDFLTELINNIDQPSPIGLPFVVELKHADAIELAEQLNALLAEDGQGATISAPERGLSGQSLSDIGDGGGGGGDTGGQAGTLQFPWQRGGRTSDEESPESPLIGKVRIVPIVRQNALAILCPRPQEEAVQELVSFFDRPGRQVMLEVVIAEVELVDDLALGLRISSSDAIATAANPDNLIAGSFDTSGNEDNPWDKLFDTSVLDANLSLSVVIQALNQKTNVRVLQQPVVFTADNQEAFFFDGQSIPFISQSTTLDNGNPNQSFDYQDVGVILNARPRITKTGDVDIELRLELSAVVPGQTLFGGAIIDRRQTSTHVVVKNGQTIVLSGILRDTESKIERGVPFLMDIPLIGELFKSRENSVTRSELVAFITPRVVDNPDMNDTNFQEDYRDRLRGLTEPISVQQQELRDNPGLYRDRMRPLDVRNQLDAESVGNKPEEEEGDTLVETSTNVYEIDVDDLTNDDEKKDDDKDKDGS